jgi:preprotein translocase subunit Sec61beta
MDQRILAPIARILLRYLAGGLVAFGIIAPEDAQIIHTDPEIVMAVGLALGAIVEGVYALAKRKGWAT